MEIWPADGNANAYRLIYNLLIIGLVVGGAFALGLDWLVSLLMFVLGALLAYEMWVVPWLKKKANPQALTMKDHFVKFMRREGGKLDYAKLRAELDHEKRRSDTLEKSQAALQEQLTNLRSEVKTSASEVKT